MRRTHRSADFDLRFRVAALRRSDKGVGRRAELAECRPRVAEVAPSQRDGGRQLGGPLEQLCSGRVPAPPALALASLAEVEVPDRACPREHLRVELCEVRLALLCQDAIKRAVRDDLQRLAVALLGSGMVADAGVSRASTVAIRWASSPAIIGLVWPRVSSCDDTFALNCSTASAMPTMSPSPYDGTSTTSVDER